MPLLTLLHEFMCCESKNTDRCFGVGKMGISQLRLQYTTKTVKQFQVFICLGPAVLNYQTTIYITSTGTLMSVFSALLVTSIRMLILKLIFLLFHLSCTTETGLHAWYAQILCTSFSFLRFISLASNSKFL